MARPTFIAANWKMNGDLSLVNAMAEALNQLPESNERKVLVCPGFPYLAVLKQASATFAVGAQDVSAKQQGAYTGEVSPAMLADFAIDYAIVGHSERRSYHQESNQLVAEKVANLISANITPILCIGESEQQREQQQTMMVLTEQLDAVIRHIGIDQFAKVILAYEPIWAIGTGKTASADMAQQTHAEIRQFIAQHDSQVAEQLTILYGGSVNAANSKELFAQPDIDGGLIGGASLKVDEFLTICRNTAG